MEEEDQDYEIQKPHMQSTENEEQIEDLTVNKILIFDLQMINKSMNNNYKSERFGMQRSEDDLSRVSAKLAIIYIHSSRVFAQSSDLLA